MTSQSSSNPASYYTVGVDLGQSEDPTAIAIVRTSPAPHAEDNEDPDPLFQVGYLERLPLNTPYPGVIGHVGRLLAHRNLRPSEYVDPELVIDYTGVGRPVFDLFQAKGLSPIGVGITSGDTVIHDKADPLIWKVPKIVLIGGLQAMLNDERLKIQKTLSDAPALVSELQDMRARVTDSGYWKFGAREGKHDDLVLALAIAVWRAHIQWNTGRTWLRL
jgi:hypothetical protein